MATTFGLQQSGFTAPLDGGPNRDLYGDFDFEKYDYKYNPWGSGSEAEAMKQSFEEKLSSNLTPALQQYTQLKNKKYGYSYQQIGGQPATSGIRFSSGGGVSQSTGSGGAFDGRLGGTKVLQSAGNLKDGDAKYSTVQIGRSYADRSAREAGMDRGDKTVEVKPQALSAEEEYMLWRYDVRYSQTMQDVGLGASEDDVGLSYQTASVDKLQQMQAGSGQKGPVTAGASGRAERQSGKKQFTSGVQL